MLMQLTEPSNFYLGCAVMTFRRKLRSRYILLIGVLLEVVGVPGLVGDSLWWWSRISTAYGQGAAWALVGGGGMTLLLWGWARLDDWRTKGSFATRPRSSREVEQDGDPVPELSAKPSSASEAFNRAPNSGKLAARYILEQGSADEAELILETFRRQKEKSDEIFPEAAWCELLLHLGDERVEEAQEYFGWIFRQ